MISSMYEYPRVSNSNNHGHYLMLNIFVYFLILLLREYILMLNVLLMLYIFYHPLYTRLLFCLLNLLLCNDYRWRICKGLNLNDLLLHATVFLSLLTMRMVLRYIFQNGLLLLLGIFYWCCYKVGNLGYFMLFDYFLYYYSHSCYYYCYPMCLVAVVVFFC